MFTKILTNQIVNNNWTMAPNNDLMEIDFKGTPLETEIMVLKLHFIRFVYSDKSEMEIIKYSYESSKHDLESLKKYFDSNSDIKNENFQKVATTTKERIHARANNIKKYNDLLSNEKEMVIMQLNKLMMCCIEQRNKTKIMKKDFENLKEKKEFLQKELNRSLGFFKSIFSIFHDFKAGTKDQLRGVEDKLKKMRDSMTETEMVLFIENTEKFQKSLFQVNEIFRNYKKYIDMVEASSNELLMIKYNDPNVMDNINKAYRDLDNYPIDGKNIL